MGEIEKPDDEIEQDEDQREESDGADDDMVNPLAPPINIEPGS